MIERVFQPNLLDGKVALVTGGGSGIGAGIARVFSQMGARLALLGRRLEKLEAEAQGMRAAGREALCVAADVREYEAVEAAVARTVETFGRLDVVVNAAAGNFLAPAAALSSRGFRSVVDIDLVGTFHVCRAAFAELSKTRGCVVNISAGQAFVPMPLQCHAGAAKAGIEKLTRDLALEWASSGVRVNAVVPGPVEGTEGVARLMPPGAEDKVGQVFPLVRLQRMEEIVAPVLFLASPAGAYVTGASFVADGGLALVGAGPFLELFKGGA